MKLFGWILIHFMTCAALAAETTATETVSSEDLPVTIAVEAPQAEAVKESEIPLQLDAQSQASAEKTPLTRFAVSFVLLTIMVGGAWYLMRRHRKRGDFRDAQQIKVTAQHWLGPKKSLAIIRVAGESILIGVTDHNISLIKPLSLLDDELPEETPARFQQAMRNHADGENEEIAEDDFQMSGLHQIKDGVSKRLKEMRAFYR